MLFSHADAYQEVEHILQRCVPAVTAVKAHEAALYQHGIVGEGSWELLHLEHTLLQLSARQDPAGRVGQAITRGVLYMLPVPQDDGTVVVR